MFLHAGAMTSFYYACVHLHIYYGIELYGKTSSTHIDKLIKNN